MLQYSLKRILMMLLTLFIVITVTFFMMHSIPGDPLANMAKKLPEATLKNYYAKYGLDKPVPEQYKIFMKNLIVEGDLGESIAYPGRSISRTISETAPVSAQWGFVSLIIGLVIGIALGMIAALNRNSWPDYLVSFIAMLGVCLPVFTLAALLQLVFTLKLGWLPSSGWGTPAHFALPVMASALGTVATYARYTRSNVLEVLNQDYILTAEAKGVSRGGILTKHVMRNAMLPLVTMLGPRIAAIFTGSFLLEKMFSIPGLGFYFYNSVTSRDYTMIIGTTVFYAALFMVANLVVDLLYGLIDPRIRVGKRGL
ncbi:MAG: ABC transporter permease [Eubacteriales bacterium]|nr:ABC transporter permease [Eubacteriales bacterium]